MMIQPDVLADIKFYTTEQNGLKTEFHDKQLGTVFHIENDKHDCRLLLNNIGTINPGDYKKDVPIKFLCSDLVVSKLSVGNKFYLGHLKNIGEGEITKIFQF